MALILCPDCRAEISDAAISCPRCGHPNEKTQSLVLQTDWHSNTKNCEPRSVGFWLGIGIIFLPIVFAWFTLRKGHSALSRVIAFGWLAVSVYIGSGLDKFTTPSLLTASSGTEPSQRDVPGTTYDRSPTSSKKYVEVQQLAGSSEKRGASFYLNGGDAKLIYKSSGSIFIAYVVQQGHSLEREGGFPEVSCTKSCDDETQIVKEEGDYYLDVKGSGAWTVTIQQAE